MFSASEHTRVPSLCPRVKVPRAQAPAGVFPLLVVVCSLLCAGCCSCCSRPCNTRPASRLPQCQRPGAVQGGRQHYSATPNPYRVGSLLFWKSPQTGSFHRWGIEAREALGNQRFVVTAGDPKTWCSLEQSSSRSEKKARVAHC